MTNGRATTERTRIAAAVAAIVVLNGFAWLLLFSGPPKSVTFTAAALLAYGLGLRHGLDADHIAAIDDTTRMLVGRGHAPIGTGMYFALGHSVVVLVLGGLVALASHSLGSSESGGSSLGGEVGALLGSLLVAAFLLTVGTLNLISWRELLRTRARARRGELTPAEIRDSLAGRGLMNRIAGQRTQRIGSSRGMFVVGLIFGLGLGTASEIVVLTSGAAVANPQLPWLSVMALPLLFVAGMVTTDTFDGIFMSRLYRSSSLTPERSLDLALMTTGLTVVIALGVGAVYAAEIAVHFGADFLAPLAAARSHFTVIGLVIVLAYAALWGGCSLLWRTASTPRGSDPA